MKSKDLKELNGTEYAIGFIKSRKAFHKVEEYYENMESRMADAGLKCLFIDIDSDGGRDIDRPQLDEVFCAMEMEHIHHLFLRDVKDITDDWEDIMEFVRMSARNDVILHFVNLEPYGKEIPEKVWDGGCGC